MTIYRPFVWSFLFYTFYKEKGDPVSEKERLVNCGYTEEMAEEICRLYEKDTKGLSLFVRIMELFYDDRREYV